MANHGFESVFNEVRRGFKIPMRPIGEITVDILGAAMKVHSVLGPGLLESYNQVCLTYELRIGGLQVAEEVNFPVVYANVRLDAGYRMDLVVDDAALAELKSVDEIVPIHEAPLLSYPKLSGLKVGLS
jgi:GxxExxY protein